MDDEDLSRPAFRTPLILKRREDRQDREGAKGAPLSVLRGVAAGTLGMPGDIESLLRMLTPGVSNESLIPNTEYFQRVLPLRQSGPTAEAFENAGTMAGSPALLKLAGKAPAVIRQGARNLTAPGDPFMANRQRGVVKLPAGNWLSGSVEKAVEPLKRPVQTHAQTPVVLERTGLTQAELAALPIDQRRRLYADLMTPEQLGTDAVNSWIEKTLSKYIRNEMATEGDPVRLGIEAWQAEKAGLLSGKQAQIDKAVTDMATARASRGFTPEMMTRSQARIRGLEKEKELIEGRTGLHAEIQPLNIGNAGILNRRRESAGFPAQGMGKSELAQQWEDVADELIHNLPAGDRLNTTVAASEKNLMENPWLAKVPPETMTYGVYGQHLTGHSQFGHLIDELRNALNPESGLARELLVPMKDLPKLTVPQAVERVDMINAWRAAQKAEADLARASNVATHTFKEYAENNPKGLRWVELKSPEVKTLEGLSPEQRSWYDEYLAGGVSPGLALKESSKRSNKFLEDALKYEGDMLQHCVGGYCPDVAEGRSRIMSLRDTKGKPHATIELKPSRTTTLKQMNEGTATDFNISQIKGLKNAAPSDEVQPFVQDFVKSGQWGDVGDLHHTGLIKHPTGKYVSQADMNALAERHFGESYGNRPSGSDTPDRYAERIRRYEPGMLSEVDLRFLSDWDAGNFAQGGLVEYNPAHIGTLVNDLEEQMYG